MTDADKESNAEPYACDVCDRAEERLAEAEGRIAELEASWLPVAEADLRIDMVADGLKARLAASEKRNAELVKALEAYKGSFHSPSCPACPPGCGDKPCECGYDEAEELTFVALGRRP